MASPFACSALARKSFAISAFFLLVVFFSSTPLRADSVLNFPRLSTDPNILTGVAIVNPTASDAQVTITAYGADGTPLGGKGVTNPVTATVPAGQQFSKLSFELFGSALSASSASWFQATSTTDGLTGFFLILNSSITLLDGSDVPIAAQKILFNNVRIDSGYTTELNIVNPGSSDAHVTLRLAGTYFPPAPQSLTVPAHGAARLDTATFFSVTDITAGAYVVADSDADVAGFELVQSPTADAFALNARRSGEQLSSLYFLQISVLGNFDSYLSVVNYSGDPVVLTITAFKPDGTLFDSSSIQNNPVTRALNSEASLRENIQSMFGFSGNNPLEGWIMVKSTSSAINGFISYGDISAGAVAAVTSPAEGQTRAVFAHLTTSSGFSTGLSLLNPGSLAANVRVLALKANGSILGVFDTVLQPQQRFKGQLGTSDLIPQAAGQTGGFIYIKSDLPIYMSSLIGTANAWVNVPGQSSPDSFNPDAAISTLKMNPSIAIVPPGSSQRFTVTGGSSALNWKVNGIAGGAPATGVISSSGVFTAPRSIPARQVVTITADSASQSAGASADVIDKAPFLSGLSIIESVTYLDTLSKVYSAELSALASAPSAFNAATPAGNSQIFEVSTIAPKIPIALYPGEFISKIIPFKADNGTQFLLLAAQTSGRIIRLNPVTKDSKYVVTGLNQPASMVIDTASGDLLVVEQNKVSTVSKSVLQSDLPASEGNPLSSPAPAASSFAALVLPQTGGAGIAIDRCTGFIYYSLADQGTIMEYHPAIGTSLLVASGLNNPGQLLGIYRSNVSCPDSFHLLVAERGANRLDLVIPHDGIVTPWVDAGGIVDLAFLPVGNPTIPYEGILLGDYTLEVGGVIYVVPLSTLYDSKPANPPQEELVERKTDISVSQTHSPDPATSYEELTFTVTVTNKGPAAATGVLLTDTLPADVAFISATISQGNCGQARNLVNCTPGNIPVGGTVTAAITVAPNYVAGAATRTIRNTASASSVEVDTDPANNTSTNDVTVAGPVPAVFAFSGIPASIVSGTPVSMTVTSRDRRGNIVPIYTGTVYFNCSDESATLPSSYTFLPGDGGTHTFTVTFRTSGTQTITVQDTSNSALSGTKSVGILPASFSLSSAASTAVPGSPFSITVTPRDAGGYTAYDYRGTVTFSSSDSSATLPANYTFTSSDEGSHTFAGAFALQQIGSQTITVRDATNSAVAGTMTFSVGVTPGVVSLQITASPTSITAGNATTITVRARDQLGNTVTNYTGTIRFTTADTSAYIDYEWPALNGYTSQFLASDNGTKSFIVAFYKTGSSSFSAADTVNASISGSASISVGPGPASSFWLTNLPSTVAVGVFNTLSIAAIDNYGNVATNYTGTIRFSSTDTSATLPADSTLTNGAGIFNVRFGTFTCESSWPLAVTDTVNPALTNSLSVVVAGPAYTFNVQLTPASPTAGVFADIRVTAQDVCFNTAVGFTGNISFNTTDSNALPNGDSSYTFTLADAGVHNFTGSLGVQFRVAGPQTITVSGAGNPGIWSGTVLPGPAAILQLSSNLTYPATASTPFNLTATVLDQFGNTATGYTGTIHLTSTDTGAILPGDYTFVSGDGGVHIFTMTLPCNPTNGTTITGTDTLNVTQPGSVTLYPCGG